MFEETKINEKIPGMAHLKKLHVEHTEREREREKEREKERERKMRESKCKSLQNKF